jgi:hypothetical protein
MIIHPAVVGFKEYEEKKLKRLNKLMTTMTLKEFLDNGEKKIADISILLDKTYKHPGDFFPTRAAKLLELFGLSGDECDKLKNTVSAEIKEERDPERLDSFFKRQEKEISVFDWLGWYDPKNKLITFYFNNIAACAQRLDEVLKTRRGSPCATTLFYMVFLHELGHALHHSMLCFCKNANLGKECETLAQHFTVTCIVENKICALDVFDELEKYQPAQYKKWRNKKPYKWEKCRWLFENNKEVIAHRKIMIKFKQEDRETACDLLDI